MTQSATVKAFTRGEAAGILAVSPGTLAKWAKQGRGPRYSRTGERGGRVLYTSAAIAEWLESRKVDPSSKGR